MSLNINLKIEFCGPVVTSATRWCVRLGFLGKLVRFDEAYRVCMAATFLPYYIFLCDKRSIKNNDGEQNSMARFLLVMLVGLVANGAMAEGVDTIHCEETHEGAR